ncbi:MAG: MOP flippase family protein [Candidatus Heimdallarchaeota archaeon]
METLREKTVKGFFWTGTAKILEQLSHWVISIILARLLFPTDYGLMAMAMIFMQFFHHFREFSIGGAIVQKKEIDNLCINSAFWFLCFTGLVAFALIFLSSDFIGMFFKENRLPEILIVLGLTLILSSLTSVPISLLSKELHFDKVALARTFSIVTMGLVSVLFAYLGHGVWSLVYGAITRNLILTVLSFYFARWKPGFEYSFESIKPLFSFGIPMTGAKFLTYLIQNADYFIVGKFLGGELLGLYYMAFNLSSKPIGQVAFLINEVNYPVFSKLQDSMDELKNHFLTSTRYLTLIVFPAMIGLFLIADDFVITLLGEKWVPMVATFKILSIVGIFKSLEVLITPLLYGKGESRIVFRYSLISAIVLTLSFLVGVKFGISGVAFSWLVAYPPLLLYILLLGLKEIGISLIDYIKSVIPAVSGTVFMAAVVVVSQVIRVDNPLLGMVISIVIGITSYVSFLWITNREISEELKNVVSFLIFKRTRV